MIIENPEPLTHLDPVFLTRASPWCMPLQVLNQTTSTNDELLTLGENNHPEGTFIFAEYQSAGRGQFHRHWSSLHGLGLWFSLLLRLAINDINIPLLSYFPAVALMETLHEFGVKQCFIKPPNDILILRKKIAGILVETRNGKNSFAVVGIGLNVNHHQSDFPPELHDQAISLAMVLNREVSRNSLAALLIQKLWEKRILMRDHPDVLRDAWASLTLPIDDQSSDERL